MREKARYLATRVSYDIETTSMREAWTERKIAFGYIFTVCVDGEVFRFRSLYELRDYLLELAETQGAHIANRLVVWVHNLSYEFHHGLKAVFEWDDVFAISDRRKIARATTVDGIEFRCTLLLTNLPLALVGKDVGVPKLKGDLDYDLVRHSGTQLTAAELGYVDNDVLILDALITQRLGLDDMGSIPMTKTGYVRRQVRQAVTTDAHDHALIKKLTLTTEDYLWAKRVFSGGYTHANAEVNGQVLYGEDPHDMASAYPAVIATRQFPMSRFFELPTDKVMDNLGALAMMLDITLYDIECKYRFAYISESKCDRLSGDAEVDNGRVHSAESLRIKVTDVDLQIILRNYEIGGLEINGAKAAQYDRLPRSLVAEVLSYYVDKTALKGIPGQEHRYKGGKENANSVYGMICTDPIKTQFEHIGGGELAVVPSDIPQEVADHNKSRSRFLFYPWGAWVTAWTRYELLTMVMDLEDAGVRVDYTDTDSKYSGPHPAAQPIIDAHNEAILARIEDAARELGIEPDQFAPLDPEGKAHPIGLWEHDNHGEPIEQFKTLGAKRYATVKGGKFEITVAGLNKSIGSAYVEAHGGMDFFQDGMTIPAEHSGRLVHHYSDDIVDVVVTDYQGNDARVFQEGFVHLEAAPYTLAIGDRYLHYLQQLDLDGVY